MDGGGGIKLINFVQSFELVINDTYDRMFQKKINYESKIVIVFSRLKCTFRKTRILQHINDEYNAIVQKNKTWLMKQIKRKK